MGINDVSFGTEDARRKTELVLYPHLYLSGLVKNATYYENALSEGNASPSSLCEGLLKVYDLSSE